MGIDLIDIQFRVKRELGVELDLPALFRDPDGTWDRTPPDVTAGDLHDAIIGIAASHSVALPLDTWPIVQGILCDCLAVDMHDVSREALLMKDLGMQ